MHIYIYKYEDACLHISMLRERAREREAEICASPSAALTADLLGAALNGTAMRLRARVGRVSHSRPQPRPRSVAMQLEGALARVQPSRGLPDGNPEAPTAFLLGRGAGPALCLDLSTSVFLSVYN